MFEGNRENPQHFQDCLKMKYPDIKAMLVPYVTPIQLQRQPRTAE